MPAAKKPAQPAKKPARAPKSAGKDRAQGAADKARAAKSAGKARAQVAAGPSVDWFIHDDKRGQDKRGQAGQKGSGTFSCHKRQAPERVGKGS